jgi:pyridoxine 5-phosphate synthase
MAATDEMQTIALRHRPHACCIVPERREERTTEGGLDLVAGHSHLAPYVARLRDAGIRVSLFIAPDVAQVETAARLGAPVVEFHTGPYCHATGSARAGELARLARAADLAHRLGIECHAGHGLDYETVVDVAALPELAELNIGHFLIGEAIFVGLAESIRGMQAAMARGRGLRR